MKTKVVNLIVWLLTVTSVTYCHAQDSTQSNFTAKNAVYLELGGTSVFYSLNYDRLFSDKKKWKVGARAGFGLVNLSRYDSRLVGEFYALKGRQNRYLELGIGALYRAPRQSKYEELVNGQLVETAIIIEQSAIFLSPRIGYRSQKQSGGSIFRAGFTPNLYREYGRFKVTPWVGISYGYSF